VAQSCNVWKSCPGSMNSLFVQNMKLNITKPRAQVKLRMFGGHTPISACTSAENLQLMTHVRRGLILFLMFGRQKGRGYVLAQLQHNQRGHDKPESVIKGYDFSGIMNIGHTYPLGMIQYTIRSKVVLCPTEQPPQKNSTAQYRTVLDNVITAAANPITGADGHDDTCVKYT
jgi:hypothetical protein